MNIRYTLHLFIFTVLSSSIPSAYASSNFSFDTVRSWFGGKQYEKTVTQKYIAPDDGAVHIETHSGNITIKVDAHTQHIQVTAVKKAKKAETLDLVQLAEEQTTKQLRLKPVYDERTVHNVAVDYTICVPTHLAIEATTHNGSIAIDKIHCPTSLSTDYGTISVDTAYKQLKAFNKCGAITVNTALGNIEATSERGEIVINKAHKNVHAHTKKGNVVVTYGYVPPTSAVDLHTDSGSILLSVPTSTNATIQGSTKHGTVTSDHYLTLKEQLTKLDIRAWRKFKREINGMIGSGEALIKLSSLSGNVKIMQTKQTS